jgi:hypothetical protein
MAPTPCAVWTLAQDQIVVDTLKNEKDAGKQAQSGWKKASIEAVRVALAAAKVGRSIQQIVDWIAWVCSYWLYTSPVLTSSS